MNSLKITPDLPVLKNDEVGWGCTGSVECFQGEETAGQKAERLEAWVVPSAAFPSSHSPST